MKRVTNSQYVPLSCRSIVFKNKDFLFHHSCKWDADFYVKVDDDIHVNLGMHSLNIFIILIGKKIYFTIDLVEFLTPPVTFVGMLGTTLARHCSKPRVYIGCMKSRPVLS